MHQFLPFIVIGLATGAVYGLAGTGLVLTYKTSGIFNFGYGAIAALNVFIFYLLFNDLHVPWPVAAAICVLVFAPMLGLGMERLARALERCSDTIKVVATVGLILIVEAIGVLWHGTSEPTVPTFLSQSTIGILGVQVSWSQIIVFAFSLVASGVLYWFFVKVRMGILMRGVVDNADLVAMSADDPVRVRRWAWIIGTSFASIAGLLLAPGLQLDGIVITTAVFASFGAAAIGYFSNMPLTFVGGLVVGIASALVDKYSATLNWVGGLAPSLPFLILFVVLIVIRRGKLEHRSLTRQALVRRAYRAPLRLRLVAGVVVVVLLCLVPTFQSGYLTVWSGAIIDLILFLSLGLLVRQAGQISLCQLAFAAVGAAAFGHFATDFGLPWFVALVLAMLVAVPVGAIIAIPAVRLSGVFLALATLGFGILAADVFYDRSFMFGASSLGVVDPRPNISIGAWNWSSGSGFYYLLIVIAVIVVALLTAIRNGRLGRLLEALADSPMALETNGATSSVVKVLVFCIAAAIASLSGALTGMLYHYGVGSYFDAFDSLTLVALVVIITIGDPWYALIAAVGYAVIPGYFTSSLTSTWLELLFGVSAVGIAFANGGSGMPASLRHALDRLGGRTSGGTPVAAGPAPEVGTAEPSKRAPSLTPRQTGTVAVGSDGLVVRDLVVRFGGVKAVNRVSLQAPTGRITGLVGPNGAGKTTTFNACSGLVRPTSGSITLHGADIGRSGPAQRARRGLGRTFQRTELFDSLTVRQNVVVGCEAALAGRNPLAQVAGSRHATKRVASATEEALALTGTNPLADLQAGVLTIGQRRLVELARTLAGPFSILLLDEPSSGLDGHETEQFGQVLTTVVRARQCGILLVEHDMTLVRSVCELVYVLEFGSVIFSGNPDQMLQSDVVRSAYLGDAEPEVISIPSSSAPRDEEDLVRPGESGSGC